MEPGFSLVIANALGVPLNLWTSHAEEGTRIDLPEQIGPSAEPVTVAFRGDIENGAEASVTYAADVDGCIRLYTWSAHCPADLGTDSSASGPGIVHWESDARPLRVAVEVMASTTGWESSETVWGAVKHVFVLCLENRSFDHLLGGSGMTGIDAVTKASTTINGLTGSESNTVGGQTYTVSACADGGVMPVGPGHEFDEVLLQLTGSCAYEPGDPYPATDNSGFAADFASLAGVTDPGLVMQYMPAEDLPILNALATEFAVCDNWHASMPGPTWPNRFFLFAGSSGGLDRSPAKGQLALWESHSLPGVSYTAGLGVRGFAFSNPTVVGLSIEAWGERPTIYYGDVGPAIGRIPIAAALADVSFSDLRPYSKFESDLASGSLKHGFTFIEPNYGNAHSDFAGGTSQHPLDGTAGGEALIKSTYEAIRNSPMWNSSVLIVTWDEHGGFYDHVAPDFEAPTPATPPGDEQLQAGVNLFGFTFDQYGPRVPAVVISPLIEKNVIDHRFYEHSSVVRAVNDLADLPPVNARVASVLNPLELLTLTTPRVTPTTLPPVRDVTPASHAAAAAVGGPAPSGGWDTSGALHIAHRLGLSMAAQADEDDHQRVFLAITSSDQADVYVHGMLDRLQAWNPAASSTPATEGAPQTVKS